MKFLLSHESTTRNISNRTSEFLNAKGDVSENSRLKTLQNYKYGEVTEVYLIMSTVYGAHDRETVVSLSC